MQIQKISFTGKNNYYANKTIKRPNQSVNKNNDTKLKKTLLALGIAAMAGIGIGIIASKKNSKIEKIIGGLTGLGIGAALNEYGNDKPENAKNNNSKDTKVVKDAHNGQINNTANKKIETQDLMSFEDSIKTLDTKIAKNEDNTVENKNDLPDNEEILVEIIKDSYEQSDDEDTDIALSKYQTGNNEKINNVRNIKKEISDCMNSPIQEVEQEVIYDIDETDDEYDEYDDEYDDEEYDDEYEREIQRAVDALEAKYQEAKRAREQKSLNNSKAAQDYEDRMDSEISFSDRIRDVKGAEDNENLDAKTSIIRKMQLRTLDTEHFNALDDETIDHLLNNPHYRKTKLKNMWLLRKMSPERLIRIQENDDARTVLYQVLEQDMDNYSRNCLISYLHKV